MDDGGKDETRSWPNIVIGVGNPFVKKKPKRHLKIFLEKCGEVDEELLAFVASRIGE